MLRSGLALSVLLLGRFGCGGRVSDDNVADAAVDPVPVDSGVFIDTSPPPFDSGRRETHIDPPPGCAQSIAGFACTPAADRTGKTVCTDAMIEEFLNCFGSTGSEKRCTDAQKNFPECKTCFLTDWLKVNPDTGAAKVDIAACIKKIDPASTCSGTVNCSVDCVDWVCAECDDTPGSGSTSSSSEALDCARDAQSAGTASKPKGACYDLGYKDYEACESDPKFARCFLRTIEDLRYFYRGACRDGGDWSNVAMSK
jgi:hypothetical protein